MKYLEKYIKSLKKLIIPQDTYELFPRIEEREKWDDIISDNKAFLISLGERYLNFKWPFLPVIRYLDFKRNGNRSRFEEIYFKRRNALGALLIAEIAEGEGRFIEDIMNGLWVICEETTWVVPAHMRRNPFSSLPHPKFKIIDLFSADTGALLAITHHILSNTLMEKFPQIAERVEYELEQRIIGPYLERDNYGWMGFTGRKVNNWNPWINSNVLTVFLLMEESSKRRINGISKIIKSLDIFIDQYPEDGGCDEGPGYWFVAGGSLLDALQLLFDASNSKINIFHEDLIGKMMKYIQALHINNDYFVNFADAAAKFKPQTSIIYRAGKLTNNKTLINFALHILDFKEEILKYTWFPVYRPLSYLKLKNQFKGTDEIIEYHPNLDNWYNELQVMTGREYKQTDKGFYIAAKGGNNNESHNHNDVGNFIVYFNGEPFIIDIGVEQYTKKTFSSERYSIWTMQSAYHNLPIINNEMQKPGAEYKATDVSYNKSGHKIQFKLNLKNCYPEELKLEYLYRIVEFNRFQNTSINIKDEILCKKPIENYCITLLTLPKPDIQKDQIKLVNKNKDTISIDYDRAIFSPEKEYIQIKDEKLKDIWGDSLYRIKFNLNSDVRVKNIREIKYSLTIHELE